MRHAQTKMGIAQYIRQFQHDLLDWILDHCPGLQLRKRADQLINQFQHVLISESSLLDIGSGPGAYYATLKLNRYDITLLDIKKL